ncbi:hypothetical protein BGX29_003189 [Mortierella sp. GBA35]|nr:hypothetical protein BGX29_003189 [Mortierella sp. GBA35]
MFTENQVNEAIAEMKAPNIATWDLFSEVPNFKVYRRSVPNSSLKEYKVLGSYPGLPTQYLLTAYIDLDYRKSWDSNMIGWKALPNHRLHFIANFPWLLYPCDYVLRASHAGIRRGRGLSPERSGTVRVDEFRQDVVIQPTEDGRGCNIWFGYYDNPKGNIPSSIINWAAKSGIPSFLNSMRDAGIRLKADEEKGIVDEKIQPLSSSTATPIPVN